MKAFSLISFSVLVLTQSLSATPLDGKWKTDCAPVSQGYMQDFVTFTANTFEKLTMHSDAQNCSNPNIRIETTGEFAALNRGEEMPAPVNFWPGSTFMTPLNGGIAFSMNLVGLCGIRNWKANQKRDVSGKNCDGETISNAGETIYNIYAVENSFLYLGEFTSSHDGSSPDTRPTTLDRNRPLQKQ